MKKIFKAHGQADLERCYHVIKELRPHLSFEEFLSIYNHAKNADSYELVAVEQGGQILAVMGYRFLTDFVRGKHIYIDDLVSTEKARSKGLGAELLNFAEAVAFETNCTGLRLCTGVENERAVSFYEREGWTKRAYAFTKKLSK